MALSPPTFYISTETSPIPGMSLLKCPRCSLHLCKDKHF